MSDVYLQVEHVHKVYGDRAVLRGVNLTLAPGTVLGLLGKNGAGKTTLLKCALGLVKPSTGRTRVFGEDAWSLGATAKSRLGYVPQVIQHYGWMRVRQMLNYTASFYTHWNDELVNHLCARWDLAERAVVGRLSVGEAQKLAIVLALGHEPDLLVLDEPAAALDPAARRTFLNTVLEVAADGHRSVLLSTHITSDLERVANRVAVLRDGEMVYDGELDALKERVKRLHVSAPQPLPTALPLRGVLQAQVAGQEAIVSVQDFDARAVAELRVALNATVQVEDLNLEDIFLELHHESPVTAG